MLESGPHPGPMIEQQQSLPVPGTIAKNSGLSRGFRDSWSLLNSCNTLYTLGLGFVVEDKPTELYVYQISLINTDTEEEEKVAAGSVASFDIWKDTLILGSKYIQFIDMKKWEWKVNYEQIKTAHDIVSLQHGLHIHACIQVCVVYVWLSQLANNSCAQICHYNSIT